MTADAADGAYEGWGMMLLRTTSNAATTNRVVHTCIGVACTLFAGLVATDAAAADTPPAAAPLVETDFASGVQGWTIANNGALPPAHTADSITATDSDPAPLAFVAPAEYLGDLTLAYRGSLAFELMPTVRPFQPSRPAVEIIGGTAGPLGGPITLRFETPPPATSHAFAQFRVPLSEADGWTVVGEARSPSAEEFRHALTAVTDIRIEADSATAADEEISLRAVRIDRPRVRVVIAAGQSNMTGCADSRLSSYDFTPQHDLLFWHHINDAFEPLTFGSSEDSCGHDPANIPFYFGPEVSFGEAYKRLVGDDLVVLVKFADGGTSLHDHWVPPGRNGSHPNGGPVYQRFFDELDTVLARLDAEGYTYSFDGMLWMQGESDADRFHRASRYEGHLNALIADVRAYTGQADLPFIIGRIKTSDLGYDAMVQDAQVSIGQSDPWACWIDTNDLDKYDRYHYDEPGVIELGRRFANSLQRLSTPRGDANLDGRVDIEDLYHWTQNPSDENCDGIIDAADRDLVMAAVRND
ncbi:MAG: sialate O-acetylesterase [Planctomycetota bacterium]